MDLNLEGKTAVVCGSTQGIGWATACELAEMGATILLVARSEEKLKQKVEELKSISARSHGYLAADFNEPDVLRQKINDWAKENTANILVNNTGGPPAGLAIEADVQEYLTAFSQHLICNQILATELVEGMKKSGYGRIVNVISTSVKQPLPNLGVSNTVRGAVANWSKTLANELGQFNITVNNVLPGATATSRLDGIVANKMKKTGKSEEEVRKQMASASPMKRVAQPEEVANAISFLASPAASYINGINIPVDGGRTGCL
ncbi:SDR family oxidoreductase [Halocola ammonii]